MQLFSRKKALVALSLSALAALGACGDDVIVQPDVTPPVVLSISPPSLNLNIGETGSFAVQITGGSTTTPPTLSTCTSSTPSVATVALSGTQCRVTAVATGNATITATASSGGSVNAQVSVSAQNAAITNLTVSPSQANLAVGQTITITPNVQKAATAVTTTTTYATSTASVATVSATGVVTAVGPGIATITVTTTGSGAGYTTTALTQAVTINVGALAAGITSLTVQPTSLALPLGQTFNFDTATVRSGVVQPAGAPRAVITFGSSNPAVATVNQTTGAVTSVGPGTAVITVTATSPANSQFAASTLTQLISVNVSPGATVTISQINQGPIVTTYLDDSTATGSTGGTASNGQPLNGGGAAGILTSANPQVDQPIDITSVRDQIQVIANLSPNGQRVDSAVVFIRGTTGADTVRRAAARQIFSNGQANVGPITLFVNTADFSVDTAAGTANVFYKNGQKIISVAVFTTTNGQAVEIQNASNNRQTVNFNNIDGYALIYGNPARSSLNPGSNLNFFGGPGADGTGSFTVIPVFYTPGRMLTSATVGLRQGLFGSVDVCSAVNGTVPFSRETFTGNPTLPPPPIRGTINSVNGRNISGGTSSTGSTVGNANIECGGYESPSTTAGNVIAVVAATDNTNNPAPRVTFAAGYRFSTSVARPTANRFDYRGPIVPEPDIRRTGTTSTTTWAMPAVTGWVNASFDFNTTTALSTDSAVGTGNVRTVTYSGCGATNVAVPSGTGADIPECATNLLGGYVVGGTPAGFYDISTRGPYTVMFSEADRLGNIGTSVASQPFGVDKTAPLIRFSQSSSPDTTIGAFTFQAEVIDERSGFIDPTFDNGAIERNPANNANLPLATATLGSQEQFASRGAGSILLPADHTNCINPNSTTAFTSNSVNLSAQPFMTAPSCAYRVLPASSISGTLSDGYRSAFLVNIGVDGLYRYQTKVFDRAGNVSDVAARRAARDLTAPPTVTDLNVPINLDATSTPAFQVTASDNVELRASNISLGYGAAVPGGLRLRYPQMLLDARFNDFVNSPNQRDLMVPLPAPFVVSLQNTNSNVPPTSSTLPANVNVADVQATLFDVANAPGQSPTVSLAATSFTPTQNSFGTVNSTGLFTSFSITPSTAAGFNAGAGVKAQLVSSTNVTNQQFVRVDFYRLANGEYQFLGSVNTPAVADQGNTRYFTYVLPDAQFAATPTALETQQAPVATGDNIIAIGVRANGSGLVTGAATVIGSQLSTISIPVTGLPSGVSGNVTVSCPTAGINQTLTGPASIQVPAGTQCTITPNNSSPAPGTGLIFTPTPNAPFTVTSGAAGSTVTGTTINYAGGQTLNVTINGLPSAPATPVTTVSGPSGSFNLSASGTVPQLAPGSYSVGAVQSVTIGGVTYVLQTQSATSASVTPTSITPGTVTLTYVAAGTLSGQGALAAGGPTNTTLTVSGGSLTTPLTLLGSSGGLNFTTLTLAPGTYTVTSGAVAGYSGPTPTTQQVTVTAGNTATLGTAIVYTPLGSINLTTTCTSGGSVVACPAGFTNPIVVTGPNGFNQTVSNSGTLSALPAGTYTITPSGDITVNGVTYFSGGSYTVNVVDGAISPAASNFTMAGSIIVNISGLPAGTNANVVLTIQGGSTSVLTQSSVIPNVRPGTVYSIVINDVTVGGTTYTANPNNYIGLTVNSGAGTTTNIVYQ